MPGIYLLINLDETADAAIPYPPVQTFEKWLRRGLKFLSLEILCCSNMFEIRKLV
jgi:hypothetical protein